jgi:hypothetical protein
MKKLFTFTLISVCCWTSAVSADYVLVLKNGRKITVQSYREEGSKLKFQSLGGEIVISKEHIQSIQKDGEKAPSLAFTPQEETSSPSAPRESSAEQRSTPTAGKEKPPAAEEALAEQKAKEEKDYQQKLKEITEQLKELRDRYAVETRGNRGPDPAFFTSEETFRGHQDDLISRLRDAQNKPAAPGSSPAVVTPQAVPPLYNERQKVLSELRNQTYELERQRQALIEEMKQKNIDAGSLFLE